MASYTDWSDFSWRLIRIGIINYRDGLKVHRQGYKRLSFHTYLPLELNDTCIILKYYQN